MPRPTNPESGRIELLVTPEEKAAWQECADADGRRLSEWMRRKLNEIAKRKLRTPT